MLRIEKAKKFISPFGGINIVIDSIKKKQIHKLIDRELGNRSSQSTYSYSDTFLALWSIFFCGGDACEDIQEHLHKCIAEVPGMKVASPDTILRTLQSLATEKDVHHNKEVMHEYNDNPKLNALNIKMQKKLGLLKKGGKYDLDFDHQFIPTEKKDSK